MAVGAQDEQRLAAAGPVQLGQAGIAAALALVEAVAGEPAVRRQSRGCLGDPLQQGLAVGDGGRLQVVPAGQAGACRVRMAVGVDDAGDNRAPRHVPPLRLRATDVLDIIFRAERQDAAVLDRHRVDDAALRVESNETAIE